MRDVNTELSNEQPAGETNALLKPVRPTKKQKVANYLVGFSLGLIAVAIGILMYWSFTGKDVLAVEGTPVSVKPLFVKAEDNITVTLSFCKYETSQGIVYTRFVSDKTELVVPTSKDNLPSGCYKDLNFKVPIPPQLTAGKWHLNYRIDYETNPLTTVREEFNTREFTVTE